MPVCLLSLLLIFAFWFVLQECGFDPAAPGLNFVFCISVAVQHLCSVHRKLIKLCT